MNKTYRIKYNQHTGAYVAVAEISTARGKSGGSGRLVAAALLAAGLVLSSTQAMAIPSKNADGTVNANNGFAMGTGCVVSPTVTVGQSHVVQRADGSTYSVPVSNTSQSAWVEGEYGLALGSGCDAPALAMSNAVAIGNGAAASENAISLGRLALAKGVNSLALGNGAQALTDSAIAIGVNARAQGANSLAQGNGAQANMENSISLGLGAGSSALPTLPLIPTLGSNNQIGAYAGAASSQINSNLMGKQAGMSSVGGENNYVGSNSGLGVIGSNNIAIGTSAGTEVLNVMSAGPGMLIPILRPDASVVSPPLGTLLGSGGNFN